MLNGQAVIKYAPIGVVMTLIVFFGGFVIKAQMERDASQEARIARLEDQAIDKRVLDFYIKRNDQLHRQVEELRDEQIDLLKTILKDEHE